MKLIDHPQWKELEAIRHKMENLKGKAKRLRAKIEKDCLKGTDKNG